ncbi:hypothetical protein [Weissella cibaria]|uniref:hypothetical protein n=1 Tax=Weissella cibaria TaxID=137591 RepID=UPI00189AF017|nr:hypothetical protein [Weissella cibaria]
MDQLFYWLTHLRFSWITHLQVAWLALAVSMVTLLLQLWDYRTKLAVPKIYVTEIVAGTQKIIMMLSNVSSHPVSVTDLKFETSNSERFTPQFGNYKVWSNDSYVRYTDILPVTFAPSESKLLIFEIDNAHEREFSTVKVSTVKKTYTLRVVSQSNISIDRLVTIR